MIGFIWSCNVAGVGLYHMIQVVSSVAPLYSLGQDNSNKVQHQCHMMHHQWKHCIPLVKMIKRGALWPFWSCDTISTGIGIHVMLMVSSVASLYSLGQDDQNEVQHDFYWCDAVYVLLLHMCQEQIYPLKCYKHDILPSCLMSIYGKECQYMWHIWSCSH